MNFKIEETHPRKWSGRNKLPLRRGSRDYSSLESLVVFRGATSNAIDRDADVKDFVFFHLPENREFNVHMILAEMPKDIEMTPSAITQQILILMQDGHPIQRIKRGRYIYKPNRTL